MTHKHFRLDSGRINRAQKLLRTSTETETIERALDFVIQEEEHELTVLEANERFLIRDVYGELDD